MHKQCDSVREFVCKSESSMLKGLVQFVLGASTRLVTSFET